MFVGIFTIVDDRQMA